MILLWFAGAAAQPPAATPRAFIDHLYAGYARPDFSPFKHPERTFAPRLQAAIKEDSLLADGEVGYLDGDPVCQCQDAAGLRATVVRVQPQGRGHARVSVSIDLPASPARPVRFSLIRTQAGWRIADISSADEPSLLRAIEDSNRRARAAKVH